MEIQNHNASCSLIFTTYCIRRGGFGIPMLYIEPGKGVFKMKNIVIYVHGKGGSAEEAEHYRRLFPETL